MVLGVRWGLRHPRRLTVLAIASESYTVVFYVPWLARAVQRRRPRIAEASASLGITRVYQRKFAEGEKELKRAIELNPNYAMAHHWYSLESRTLGRSTEALENAPGAATGPLLIANQLLARRHTPRQARIRSGGRAIGDNSGNSPQRRVPTIS